MLKKPIYIKFLLYILMGLLLFILQGSVISSNVLGIGLLPLVPFAVAIAIYEEPLTAALVGIYIGALCGVLSIFVSGYYMFMLALLCSVFSVLSHGLLKPTLINSIVYSFVACVIILLVGYVFMYILMLDMKNSSPLYVYIAITSFFSSLLSIIIYPIVKKIHLRFENSKRID